LLDDVMCELDADRRALLVERLADGQALITTTDLAHVPGADRADVTKIGVNDGGVMQVAA
jgi:DNA replication and repair protein RecF